MKTCKKGQVCGIGGCQLPHHPNIHIFKDHYKDYRTWLKENPAPSPGKLAAIGAATKASWAGKPQARGFQAHHVAADAEVPAIVEIAGNAEDEEAGTDLATPNQE